MSDRGFRSIQRDEVGWGFKVSELNMSQILALDNNKVEYISSDQVEKDEGESCINDQSVPDKTNQDVRDCTYFQ